MFGSKNSAEKATVLRLEKRILSAIEKINLVTNQVNDSKTTLSDDDSEMTVQQTHLLKLADMMEMVVFLSGVITERKRQLLSSTSLAVANMVDLKETYVNADEICETIESLSDYEPDAFAS